MTAQTFQRIPPKKDLLDFSNPSNQAVYDFFAGSYDTDFQYASYRKHIPKSPLWCIDRHLALDFALREVVLVPTLIDDLANAHIEEFKRFLGSNSVFPTQFPDPKYRLIPNVINPTDVRVNYICQCGQFSEEYSSKLYVHPNQMLWQTVFALKSHLNESEFLHEGDLAVLKDQGERLFCLPAEVLQKMDSLVFTKLKVLRASRDTLAVFNFLPPCPESKEIVQGLDSYDVDRDWLIPKTQSPFALLPKDTIKHPDNTDNWGDQYGAGRHQRAESTFRQGVHSGKKDFAWVPPHHGKRHQGYSPNPSHFLQRAWCRAVENDATFIIFHAMDRERIGIRDRATNTLYLSPEFSPSHAGYMPLHFGLHAAIVKDALERTQIPNIIASLARAPRKRSRGVDIPTPVRASKRVKREAPVSYGVFNNDKEIASRHILLISFDMGVYRSPAPSSFLRVAASCHPDFISQPFKPPKANGWSHLTKCLNFVVKEKIGRGAIGMVYRGVMEVWTESGERLEETVVIKLPLGGQNAEYIGNDDEPCSYNSTIRNEYDKYVKMFQGGVTSGISKIHGVFEDVETGCIGLVMQDGGMDLLQRERTVFQVPDPLQITLSEAELNSLLNTMKAINRSGIEHEDVRPKNIVIDVEGKLRIIDFERAVVVPVDPDVQDSLDMAILRRIYARKWVGN